MTGPFRRAAFSALIVASLAVTAAAPAAAVAKLQVNVGIGASCISGTGVPRAVHVVSLRAPDGELRGRFRDDATRRGRWFGCFGSDFGPRASINAGDAIKIRVEGRKHTFTVPDIRPRTDRVGDVIRGRGPAGATIQVTVERIEATEEEPGIAREATVDARGRWRLDLAGEYDIVGKLRVSTRLDDDGVVTFADSPVPFLALSSAAAAVSGSANPGQTVHLRLVDGDGATRVTASTSPTTHGYFFMALQDHRGNAVYPRPGDRIESDIAADGDLLIPDSFLKADASESRITARCMPNAEFRLSTFGRRQYVFLGQTRDDGTLRRSADMQSGDRIELTCRYASGDEFDVATDARP